MIVTLVTIPTLSVAAEANNKQVSNENNGKPVVILLSVDGLAGHYFNKSTETNNHLKNLNKLARKGLFSTNVLPVFPSKTFPNHLSIVTGDYPSQHGIIHNSFYRRDKQQRYKLGAGKNDSSWLTAEPIWVTATKQGVIAATYFWPESEAIIDHTQAKYMMPYQHHTPNQQRLDKILEWLKLSDQERPQLITSYFSIVDSAGHDYGTHSLQLHNAIASIDKLLANFYQELQTFDFPISLVIVSDHGMLNVTDSVDITSLNLPEQSEQVVNGGTQLYIYESNPQHQTKIIEKLEVAQKNHKGKYSVYRNGNFPKHWHLNKTNNVIPDIIVSAHASVEFVYDNRSNAATHGYDVQQAPQMKAMFLALSPQLKQGVLPQFENIHIYALIAHLLNIKTDPDKPASLTPFKPYLVQ